MGSIPAIARGSGSRHPRTRDINSSFGLRVDEISTNLSHLAGSAARKSPSTSIETRQRQYALLAELVATIVPNQVDDIAARLLRVFGSLSGVFAAPAAALIRTARNELLATVILAARPAVLESMREEVSGAAFDLRDQRIVSYLIAKMQGEVDEHLHAVFLDQQRRYIVDERVASGSRSQVSVRIRPLLRLAIEINATWITLIHNHPSGDLRPSAEDIRFTLEVQNVAQALGIGIFDHLIISGPSIFSMRAAGLLS